MRGGRAAAAALATCHDVPLPRSRAPGPPEGVQVCESGLVARVDICTWAVLELACDPVSPVDCAQHAHAQWSAPSRSQLPLFAGS